MQGNEQEINILTEESNKSFSQNGYHLLSYILDANTETTDIFLGFLDNLALYSLTDPILRFTKKISRLSGSAAI